VHLIEGQKEGAMTMEDGLAEMHGGGAQRLVQGLVTKSGGPEVEGETPRMKICPPKPAGELRKARFERKAKSRTKTQQGIKRRGHDSGHWRSRVCR